MAQTPTLVPLVLGNGACKLRVRRERAEVFEGDGAG